MSVVKNQRGFLRSRAVINRQKFIEHEKHKFKDYLDVLTKNKNWKSMEGGVSVPIKTTPNIPPTWSKSSNRRGVGTGNTVFDEGEHAIFHADEVGDGGSGEGDGEPLDILLSYTEFTDMLFEGWQLPDFIKNSLVGDTKFKLKRAGYTPTGTINNLNIKRTLENSIMRRLMLRHSEKKPAFLEDVDIRYNNYYRVPIPIMKAVMFCVMDVSGSMTEPLRNLGLRCFYLTYLFLKKNYQHVEVRFVSHTDSAMEVDQHTFFNANRTGGTVIAPAIALVNSIIQEEYNPNHVNIYAVYCGDTDCFNEDIVNTVKEVRKLLLSTQAMLWAETRSSSRVNSPAAQITKGIGNPPGFVYKLMIKTSDCYKALKEFFTNEKA